MAANKVYLANNLEFLRSVEDESVPLIYIDPPFNTKKTQKRVRIQTVRDEEGDRVGFQGERYKTIKLGETGYVDKFDDYYSFLRPRFEEAYRILSKTGSFFLHVDYREVHYLKVMLDEIFGRKCFMNEIIWSYDFGGRSKKRWSSKHDNILWYVKDHKNYTYRYEDIDRIPYMAPDLVGPEKAAKGKTPTDVWWHTIVPTNGKERTGYATQKPLGIIERIVKVHSNPGDMLLDFFAGSGTFGEAAAKFDRNFTMVDENPEAVDVMMKRLAPWSPERIDLK
ncbi:MAG: site-specific DNA-methyltransferase [Myxococcota bacterium]|nr:site-specific DNA-methyltransferase [Myxococcota bacterium]